MELASPSTIMHPDHERAKRTGFSKTTDSAAANNAALTFTAGAGRDAAQIETILGDLIVALTEETHQFVADEQEIYEVVAYLLFARLSRRPRNLYFSESFTTPHCDKGEPFRPR